MLFRSPSGEDLVVVDKEAAPYFAFFRGESPTIERPEAPAGAPASTAKGAKPASTAPAGPATTAPPDPFAEPFIPVTDC